jgi:hypothetical protein
VLEKTQQRPIATNVHTIGVFMLKSVQAPGEILDTEGEAPESLQPDVLREVGVRHIAPNQVARREALMHRRVRAGGFGKLTLAQCFLTEVASPEGSQRHPWIRLVFLLQAGDIM